MKNKHDITFYEQLLAATLVNASRSKKEAARIIGCTAADVSKCYNDVKVAIKGADKPSQRRRDGVGRDYFYAWDQTGGRSGEVGIKSYTADKVQSIAIAEETFEPRFPIELAKSGGYFGKPHFAGSGTGFATSRRASRSSGSSMNYTVECPYCNKRFKRSKYDTKLNKHKDRFGNRCYGRVGYMV